MQGLLNTYMRYLNSPFWIRSPSLAEERERLLREPGRIYQKPLLEFLPGYKKANLTIRKTVERVGLGMDLASFIELGLFSDKPDRNLYTHQVEAIELAMKPIEEGGRHVIATSGTGSGKTECFMIPVILRLAQESAGWSKPGKSQPAWWQEGIGYRSKRIHETRRPAVRALFLYPLNALVEDQMVRLRRALDSPTAKAWLDKNRGANRFYFGGYNGRTPLPGARTQAKEENLRRVLQQMQDERQALGKEPELLPDPLGAEMVARWDMQAHPPDILVTNFSMLDIMLMRGIEGSIFDSTRKWLQEDRRHVFTLVVDELHSYRGTPGTEVALVLRLLLDRIGISSGSPQLRIIGTSASLEDSEDGKKFLREFFGCPIDSFAVLSGDRDDAPGNPPGSWLNYATAFVDFEKFANTLGFEAALSALAKSLGCAGADVRVALANRLLELGTAKLLANAAQDEAGRVVARSIEELGYKLFEAGRGGELPGPTKELAIAGMTLACSEVNDPEDGEPLLPCKVHLFFRNLTGIWACSDPRCPGVIVKGTRPVGRLYTEPRIVCECGARVLDLHYCQTCGEVFLGGYRTASTSGIEGFYLTPDFPKLDELPDSGRFDRTLNEYTLFWPSPAAPIEDTWLVVGHKVVWQRGWMNAHSGLVSHHAMPSLMPGWYLRIERPDPPNIEHAAVPKFCPNCGDYWAHQFGPQNRYLSPVRTLRPAFTKVAQILSDRLLLECSRAPSERKLVMFSDNRRETAQLARDIEFNHYQDLLRNLLLHHAGEASFSRNYLAFQRFANNASLTVGEKAQAEAFAEAFPDVALAAQLKALGRELSGRQRRELERIDRQLRFGTPLRALWGDLELSIVKCGTNPAGIALWANRRDSRGWKEAYTWNEDGTVSRNINADVDARSLREALHDAMVNAALKQIFSGRRRSLEDLGFGFITFSGEDRSIGGVGPILSRQVADSVIRILGQGRYLIYRNDRLPLEARENQKETREDPPRSVRDYLREVSKIHDCQYDDLEGGLKQWLEDVRVMNKYLLDENELVFHPAEESSWTCNTCGQQHLHPSASVCTSCLGRLAADPVAPRKAQDDFYAELANDPRTRERLHCEELTGQTDNIDAFRRLRLFRGTCRVGELPKVDEIDILNVTTTLESGVDIGELRMVMMANMPPERFNYQQRSGRCGRRSQGLSYVLTFCKGRSHDDYYFSNLKAMTADPPPSPYLDLRREQIARRVLSAELLRQAFISTQLGTQIGESDSVHGQFGPRDAWPSKRDAISSWLAKNAAECRRQVGVLSSGSEELASKADELVKYITQGPLAAAVDSAVRNSSEDDLSQALAWQGVLPMFGFPTGVRSMYLARPYIEDGQWKEKSVDRDIAIAISEFAPGSEIIRDKETHHAVGIAHFIRGFSRGRHRVELAPELLGPPEVVSFCRDCRMLNPGGPDNCPGCGNPIDNASGAMHRRHILSHPAGFRTEFRPYDGSPGDEERTYASSAKPALPPLSPEAAIKVRNARVWLAQGDFYTINDNSGRLFRFHETLNHQGWIEESQLDRPALTGIGYTGTIEERALACRKRSECLVIEPDLLPPRAQLRIGDLGVRASLYSFGFLLQRAAASYLDVDQREFTVGIRSYKDQQLNEVRGQVCLADSLANGAGYAQYLSIGEHFQEILDDVNLGSGSLLLAGMSDHLNTPSVCDPSCYECLRSYQNLRYHGILNWRLALDMARLLAFGEIPVAPDKRWKESLGRTFRSFGPEFEWLDNGPLPVIFHEETGGVAVISHPFLYRYPEKRRSSLVADAHIAAEDMLRTKTSHIVHLSYFDIVHRPWWAVDAIASGNSGDPFDELGPAGS